MAQAIPDVALQIGKPLAGQTTKGVHYERPSSFDSIEGGGRNRTDE
jgi:hypothetical protein